MIDQLRWEPLFVMKLTVGYGRAQPLGMTPLGERGVYPVDGGTFEGNRLRGTVSTGGADWVTHRADGNMVIDVRLTLVTHDGGIIGMTYTGLARGKQPDSEAFRKREMLTYDDTFLHTTPRFETGDERYSWINGVIAVTNGMRVENGGLYHVFSIL
jgi:hypothetical protein